MDDYLPPELIAMNEAMKMISNAAPVELPTAAPLAATKLPGSTDPDPSEMRSHGTSAQYPQVAAPAHEAHDLRDRLQVLIAWRDEAEAHGRVKEYALIGSLIIEYRWRLNAAPQAQADAGVHHDMRKQTDPMQPAGAAPSYWDEKAKDRREEFKREDAEDRERAYPEKRP